MIMIMIVKKSLIFQCFFNDVSMLLYSPRFASDLVAFAFVALCLSSRQRTTRTTRTKRVARGSWTGRPGTHASRSRTPTPCAWATRAGKADTTASSSGWTWARARVGGLRLGQSCVRGRRIWALEGGGFVVVCLFKCFAFVAVYSCDYNVILIYMAVNISNYFC
jgi:hypothetical protein